MISRNSKQNRLGSKTKNGDAEVFVLPPNLLQKLGIDLGNVAQESVEDVSFSEGEQLEIGIKQCKKTGKKRKEKKGSLQQIQQENTFKSPSNKTVENLSSNMETAKLLKDSVFLSPTVNNSQLISNDEVAISNGDELEILLCNQSNTNASVTDIFNEVTGCEAVANKDELRNSETIHPDSNLLLGNVSLNKSAHSEKVNDLVNQRDIPLISCINETKLNENSKKNSSDDHLDEAYSSDCSNSNPGLNEIVEQFVNIAEKLTVSSSESPNKKINIISEEILSPRQLKELKTLHNPALSLLPVDINIIIQGHQHLKTSPFKQITRPTQSETIVMYDEKGNMFDTDIHLETDISIPVIIDDKLANHNTLQSERNKLNITDDDKNVDTSFNSGIDISVDIEKHFEEDEEILEKFANEITSNSTADILDKIEENEVLDKCLDEASMIPVNYVETHGPNNNLKVLKENIEDQSIPTHNTANLIGINNEKTVPEVNTGITYSKMRIDNSNNDLSILKEIRKQVHPNVQDMQLIEGHVAAQEVNTVKVLDELALKNHEVNLNNDLNVFQDQKRQENKRKDLIEVNYLDVIQKANIITAPDKSDVIDEKHINLISEATKIKISPESTSSMGNEQENLCYEANNLTKAKHFINNGVDVVKTDEKVSEIAKYLSDYVNKKKHRRISEEKQLKKEKYIQGVNSNLRSKLSIQGVEKPGGFHETHHNEKYAPSNFKKSVQYGKTYKRKLREKAETFVVSSTSELFNQELIKLTDDHELNININISNNFKNKEFCLCGDFGRLAYYESESVYEHIHFWEHKKFNYNCNVLFSIYDENNIILTPEIDKDCSVLNDKADDLSEQFEHGICWNNIEDIRSEDIINEQSKNTISKPYIENKNAETNQIISDDSPLKISVEVFKIDDCVTGNTDAISYINNESTANSNNSITTEDVLPNSSSLSINEIENITKDSNRKLKVSNEVKDKQTQNIVEMAVDNSDLYNSSSLSINEIENITKDSNRKLKVSNEVKDKQTQKVDEMAVDNSDLDIVASIEHGDEDSSINIVKVISKPGDTDSTSRKSRSDHQDQDHNKLKDNSLIHRSDVLQNTSKLGKKRRRSSKQCEVEPENKKSIKCGVCKQLLAEPEWRDHITKHAYMAWKQGEPALDMKDDEAVQNHLKRLSTQFHGLTCTKCGTKCKNSKSYLKHTKTCSPDDSINESTATENASMEIKNEAVTSTENKIVICGVCKNNVREDQWTDHMAKHDYLSWKQGEEALDLDDDQALSKHLGMIVKQIGSLVCSKCGLVRKFGKSFLKHINICTGPEELESDHSIDEVTDTQQTIGLFKLSKCIMKCGVCEELVKSSNWLTHIEKKHNYLAWYDGQSLDIDDTLAVRNHLSAILNEIGSLTCWRCASVHKSVKTYQRHIKLCKEEPVESKPAIDRSTVVQDESAVVSGATSIKCGVCNMDIEDNKWEDHLPTHDYLAWKQGEKPLNLNDNDELCLHLTVLAKQLGPLTCSKCGLQRKTGKAFLIHVRHCTGQNPKLNESKLDITKKDTILSVQDPEIKCGVCKEVVLSQDWQNHVESHEYLTWKDGDSLDTNDPDVVYNHLNAIMKTLGGLTCWKCTTTCKHVKLYQRHMKGCKVTPISFETREELKKQKIYTCAVCSEQVASKAWEKHKMKNHYNVAWIEGDIPIDINNPYAVEKHLKEYKNYNKVLSCRICGLTRASYNGFYAHIIACGKTEKEMEKYKAVCEICKKPYLVVYYNQHMTIHREQMYVKLKKEAEVKLKVKESVEIEVTPGRRRAAEKAKKIVMNYKKELDKYKFVCEKCEFGTNVKNELVTHKCQNSGLFAAGEEEPDLDDDNIEDVDSDASIEEENRSKKKYKSNSNAPNLPISVAKPKVYIEEAATEFFNLNYSEKLFPEWRSCEYKLVSEKQLPLYMPPLKESCKVKFESDKWGTYKRFQAMKNSGFSLFTGAAIQCIGWVPPCLDKSEDGDSYLAVVCHNGTDIPRYQCDQIVSGPGLIQIWNFRQFIKVPEMVLGLAHDLGTIWAMDWCPSGARDFKDSTDGSISRLGLLAVATSNGSAFIFSVPYPSTIAKDDNIFYKLKPVAELRLYSTSSRKKFQATSLSWSQKKDHASIVVGYADGVIAYYDLMTECPLLIAKEKDMKIYYPYHDDHAHRSSVTGVSTFPSYERDTSVGLVGSCAVSGSAVAWGGGGRAGRGLAAAAVCFAPLWPAAVLAGDEVIINATANEFDLTSSGRRLGSLRAACACAGCARLALFAPPVLRVMVQHPVYQDPKKKNIAVIELLPIGKKRKLTKDDLTVVVNPLTYEDTAAKYGISLKLKLNNNNKPDKQKLEIAPDRFPLEDVPSMALCPSPNHHARLAIATHAGIIFVIKV